MIPKYMYWHTDMHAHMNIHMYTFESIGSHLELKIQYNLKFPNMLSYGGLKMYWHRLVVYEQWKHPQDEWIDDSPKIMITKPIESLGNTMYKPNNYMKQLKSKINKCRISNNIQFIQPQQRSIKKSGKKTHF